MSTTSCPSISICARAELLAGGMSEADARREATREFGDVEFTREYCRRLDEGGERAERRGEWLVDLRQDLDASHPGVAAIPGISRHRARHHRVRRWREQRDLHCRARRLAPPTALRPAGSSRLRVRGQSAGPFAALAVGGRRLRRLSPSTVVAHGYRHRWLHVTRLPGCNGTRRAPRTCASARTSFRSSAFHRCSAVPSRPTRTSRARRGRRAVVSRRGEESFGGDSSVVGRIGLMSGTPMTIIGVMPPALHFRRRRTVLDALRHPAASSPT